MNNQKDVDLTSGTGLGDVSDTGFRTDTTRTGTDFGSGNTGFGDSGIAQGGSPMGSYGTTGQETTGASGAIARTRELAGNVRDRATEKVEERLAEQKYRAADSLGNVAQSLRTASQQMPEDAGVGRYMLQAANQVDNIASFLNNKDVADLFDEVENLARRQPAVFIGGAFALGVLGARFLRSSRRHVMDDGHTGSYGSTYDPRRDSVSRPNAPGYASPGLREDGGYTSGGTSGFNSGLGNTGDGTARGTGIGGGATSGGYNAGYGAETGKVGDAYGSGNGQTGSGQGMTGSSGFGTDSTTGFGMGTGGEK